MTNPSNTSFDYAGQRYTFVATLYTHTEDEDYEVSLDNDLVQYFEYQNALNRLMLEGSIVYVDRYGKVDSFLDKQFAHCQIIFNEVEQKFDGNITIEKQSDTFKFIHQFIVNNIEVLKRNGTEITYKIHLVSSNWYKLAATVDYTNYQQEPMTTFDILKACLAANDLLINKDMFELVTSEVKLNYITNGNDNLFSIFDYLMHKQYYYKTKDQNLKFLVYAENKDWFQPFDISNKNTATGNYSLLLSFFKSNIEGLAQPEPVDIRSVTKYSTVNTLESLFNYEMTDYSYANNVFEDASISSTSIVNYNNTHVVEDDYPGKFKKWFETTLDFKHKGTYWNNECAPYHSAVDALFGDNAIMIHSKGEILRKPGAFVTLTLDRSIESAENDTPEKLKEFKRRYRVFEGSWIVGKVRHIINLQAKTYKQNLVLFRNYTNPVK